MLNDRFDHRVLYELFVIYMYTASLYLSPAIIKSVKQLRMTIKKPILTFLFLNTEFLLSDRDFALPFSAFAFSKSDFPSGRFLHSPRSP